MNTLYCNNLNTKPLSLVPSPAPPWRWSPALVLRGCQAPLLRLGIQQPGVGHHVTPAEVISCHNGNIFAGIIVGLNR